MTASLPSGISLVVNGGAWPLVNGAGVNAAAGPFALLLCVLNLSLMYNCLVVYTGAEPAEFYSVQKRPAYKAYQDTTSMFFPWLPRPLRAASGVEADQATSTKTPAARDSQALSPSRKSRKDD